MQPLPPVVLGAHLPEPAHLGCAEAADGPVWPPREPQLLVDAQAEVGL